MQMSFQVSPRRVGALLSLMLAAGCHVAQAKSTSGEPGPARAAALPAEPWWSAFHEQPLVELQHAAAAHAGGGASLEIQVASDYIGVRTINVRAMLADEMLRTILRQRQLMAGTAPLAAKTPPLAALDSEVAQARRRIADLVANRDALIEDLARLCGNTPAAMRSQLQRVLADPSIPVLDAAPPAGGPVPGRSSDVFEAMQVRDIEARQRDVQVRSEQTRTWSEIVRTRALEVDAARQRMALGAQPEFSVLATYRVMLVDNDRLADAAGELAKAWLQLHLHDAALPLQASGRLAD